MTLDGEGGDDDDDWTRKMDDEQEARGEVDRRKSSLVQRTTERHWRNADHAVAVAVVATLEDLGGSRGHQQQEDEEDDEQEL